MRCQHSSENGRRRILFVCTGNVCRSPMAEYLMRHYLGGDPRYDVESAGICAVDGAPASVHAMEVLSAKGVDLTPHRSRLATGEIVGSADMIVVMTRNHAREIRSRFPRAGDRVFTLKSFSAGSREEDVDDPIGESREFYAETCRDIEESLLDLVVYLKSASAKGG